MPKNTTNTATYIFRVSASVFITFSPGLDIVRLFSYNCSRLISSVYLRLVDKELQDPNFDRLKDAVGAGDLDKGFEAAHALKGVLANLALTPILVQVQEVTELLRSRTQTDYGPLLAGIDGEKARLISLSCCGGA